MNPTVAIFLIILYIVTAQDSNCDFHQNVLVNRTYNINNPQYPNNYSPGIQCRWQANCPSGYNCRLDCPQVQLPMSKSCSMDRLLVSSTGDPQLVGAETYCGVGSFTVVSKRQNISIGLISSQSSPGGRFYCQLTAERAKSERSTCSCGERRQSRIVGGEETGVNEYKMIAGVYDTQANKITCGAVIISQRHALSAARCVDSQPVNNYVLLVGEHDTAVADSPATKIYPIVKFTIHPQYSQSTYDYDVAIIRVQTQIEFNELVGPVCLPFKFINDDFAGDKVTVLGWGTLFPGGPDSNVLRKVDVDVISNKACRKIGPNVTDIQICTYTPGKDACQDDSGGPLLYTDPETKLLFSVGIVSYGMFCASEYPTINTRVTAVLRWIVETTRVQYCVK